MKSTAHHPQSQGALKSFHQMLKYMLRAYCLQEKRKWDKGLPLLLFSVRESIQESLEFSPFELVFGHFPCGPWKCGWLKRIQMVFLHVFQMCKTDCVEQIIWLSRSLRTVRGRQRPGMTGRLGFKHLPR